MKKHRICTTISNNHYSLLLKHAEKMETQQKVIEQALECLDKNHLSAQPLSAEDEYKMRTMGELRSACIIDRVGLYFLFKNCDAEQFIGIMNKDRSIEHLIENYNAKPLKDCSLLEVIEGLVMNLKVANWCDSVSYTDDGDHYTLKVSHSLGINGSKILEGGNESVFKSYEAHTECYTSERSYFLKIYKKL